MTLEFKKGDLFESNAEVLVCPVNTTGTMARGLAKRFAARFNGLKGAFRQACLNKQVLMTVPWKYQTEEGPLVLCVATKRHYSNPSTIRDVESAIRGLANFLRFYKACVVAVPALGCGLGGVEWVRVKPLIQKYLGDAGIPQHVMAFEPEV